MPLRANSMLIRVITLLVTLFNVLFHFAYTGVRAGANIRAVSESYPSFFTPAPYAFGIWALIGVSMLGWCVASLLPKQRAELAYDHAAPSLCLVNLLGPVWSVLFTHRVLWLSVLAIGLSLVFAAAFFVRCHRERLAGRTSLWFAAPSSLLLGWLPIATLACLTVALVASGLFALDPVNWAVLMLIVTALVGIYLAVRYQDFIVPAVAAWGTLAIWVANHGGNERVSKAAISVAIATGSLALVTLWQQVFEKPTSGPRLSRPSAGFRR